MSEGILVGHVSPFGNGQTDYMAQIWQMLISARNGTFPLQVTGGGSATVPGGLDGQIQWNNAGVFGGTASFVMSAGIVTGWSNSASQLTLTGTVSDGTTDTVRFTSAGRTDTTINAAMGNIGVLGFSTAGTRDWSFYNEGGNAFHFAKSGLGDILLFAGGTLKLSQLTSNGLLQTTGGDGTVSVSAAQLLVDDTGWTANADAGDKTAVIPVNASLNTIATALNALVTGAGDALANTAKKCKALETALAANLLPNV